MKLSDYEYHREDAGVIYLGDCLDILPLLPDNSVDLVLTDPPYGIGDMVSGNISKGRLHKTRYTKFVDSVQYVKEHVIPAIEICLSISTRMIITPGWKCLKHYPQWNSFGGFYMPAAVGMQLWGSSDCQPILYYGKPHDIGKRIHKCSFQLTEPPSCSEHPCSKPYKAWSKILSLRSETDNNILDPFLGSGTTAVAAKNLGRRFIGIEISEKYCEIAVDRLRQGVMNLTPTGHVLTPAGKG